MKIDVDDYRLNAQEIRWKKLTIWYLQPALVIVTILPTLLEGLLDTSLHTRLLSLGLLAVLTIGLWVAANSYHKYLRHIGYEWITFGAALWIYYSLGRLARKLPPATDLETLPGFERSTKGLIHFMWKFEKKFKS